MLNGIEKVKIWKSVCEKVFFVGLLVSLMFLNVKKVFPLLLLFQCEKNVLESTDGPYPKLTHNVYRGGEGRGQGGVE